MSESEGATPRRVPLLARIVDLFLRGPLTPMLIVSSLLVGALALVVTPREEDPQIVVPMADVRIEVPGLSPEEVERHVATRLEKLLFQIDGVEYVYSRSMPDRAIVTVRFFVGEDREDSLVKIYNKLLSNVDAIPASVSRWVVKPIEIDDVPIVVASLWSERPDQLDDFALRRVAEEIEIELEALPETNGVSVVGGRPRVVRVELRPDALAARQTAALDVAFALGVSNARDRVGSLDREDRDFLVDAGSLLDDPSELGSTVINVVDGIPVYLSDVARIHDGPAERVGYSWLAFGRAEPGESTAVFRPAVHVAVAKQKGANAVRVARRVEARLDELARTHLPDGVRVRITRDYGETANDKVNELVEALGIAIVVVIALIAWALGWREALIVAVAVPITFALTLTVNYAVGYTINRVTLFALILALGLVVDDPIIDVENIHRHLRLGRESALDAVRGAVNEVRPPILLATAAVMVSFLPMLFITGMMGPYMRPMALNVPIAMAMSMVVAFAVTPWLTYRSLRPEEHVADSDDDPPVDPLRRRYERVLLPFLSSRRRAWQLIGGLTLLFFASLAMGLMRTVPLKMLPFDNKNEFQVVIDMPEGTTLERTDAFARRVAEIVTGAAEVRDVTVYSGVASPMDFNGMVRQYYLRRAPELAEVRVNLVHKRERERASHQVLLRLREPLEAAARQAGARIKLVESPPGPPVIATVVAEIYGEPGAPYERLRAAGAALEERLAREAFVSDVDTTVEDEHARLVVEVDQEKAALAGVSAEDAIATLKIALAGLDVGALHVPGEAAPLPIRLRTSRAERSSPDFLRSLDVKGRPGIARTQEEGGTRDAPTPLVSLGELTRTSLRPSQRAILHKNLARVVYVFAEPVGRAPAEVIADVAADRRAAGEPLISDPRPLASRTFLTNGAGEPWSLPSGTHAVWQGEGEWKITVDVFRDLGLAFAAALVGIYLLLVYQTESYTMPFILMISIPLTLIGILPGFFLLDLVAGTSVAGPPDPIFFTATAMIGTIALSGIAVRNAILLIEFVHVELRRGTPLREALIRSGATRTRPILLTAGAAMLGAVPITLDPIFSGLAWALIFGLLVSTAFTLVVVPVAYDLVYRDRPGHGLRSLEET